MSVSTNAEFNAGMPIGSLVEYAGTTAPTSWVLCQGQALSRTTYSELFEIIGTTYGAGDGSTTFNVPDMRDRIPIGKTSTGSLGTKSGSKTATLSASNMPQHRHSFSGSASFNRASGNTVYVQGGNPADPPAYPLDGMTGQSITISGNTGYAGSGQAFSIMPPTISLNYIIKAK